MPIREPSYSVKWMAANAADELKRDLVSALDTDMYLNARMGAPFRSGELLDSIHHGVSPDGEGRVWATAPQALYTELGTKAHVIYPKAANVLRFVKNGTVIFARFVSHPGTPAQHWMQREMQRTWSNAPAIAGWVGKRWLAKHALR